MKKIIVPAGQKRLPLVIRDAVDAARNIPGLKRGIKATLAAIVSFVDKADPEARVFARKEKIAQRADCTDRTIRSHMRVLEAEGFIVSHEQGHCKADGKFKVTHIQLTEKTKAIIGLEPVDNSAAEEPDDEKFSVPSPDFSAPANKGFLSEPSSISNKQPHAMKSVVPKDLAYLSERMDAWGIFSLMKKAKANGKLLSDVAACAQARIEKLDLHGGQAYRYLSALILSGACFIMGAREAKAEQCHVDSQVVAMAKVAAYQEQWKGKQYINRKGTMIIEVDSNGLSAVVHYLEDNRTAVIPLNNIREACGMVEAIENGQILESSNS